MLLNRNKRIGEEFFVFCKFAFPSILLLTPTAAKLSIFTDMIIEIQITTLLAKLPRESLALDIF